MANKYSDYRTKRKQRKEIKQDHKEKTTASIFPKTMLKSVCVVNTLLGLALFTGTWAGIAGDSSGNDAVLTRSQAITILVIGLISLVNIIAAFAFLYFTERKSDQWFLDNRKMLMYASPMLVFTGAFLLGAVIFYIYSKLNKYYHLNGPTVVIKKDSTIVSSSSGENITSEKEEK